MKSRTADHLLVIVNKQNRLPSGYRPSDLVDITKLILTTKKLKLRKEAAKSLSKMSAEAKKQKINIIIISAFRSYRSQKIIFAEWVEKSGFKNACKFSAEPGYSQHQLGTTVDFTSTQTLLRFSSDFVKTRESKWLSKNAHKYGFVLSYPKGKEKITGYIFEPWHYRYIGVENAAKMINSGLILEEFLKKYGVK